MTDVVINDEGLGVCIYSGNAVYATARSTSNTTGGTNVGQFLTGGNYYCYRIPLKFDLSAIPANAIISSVTLKMAITADASSADFDISIDKMDWSAYDPIDDVSKRESTWDLFLSETLDDNIWRNTSGIATNTYYTSGALDTAYPTAGGNVYYGLVSAEDRNASAPAGAEYIAFDMVTKVPQLLITYSLPSSGPMTAYLSDYGII